jgi:hypothetical protein
MLTREKNMKVLAHLSLHAGHQQINCSSGGSQLLPVYLPAPAVGRQDCCHVDEISCRQLVDHGRQAVTCFLPRLPRGCNHPGYIKALFDSIKL